MEATRLSKAELKIELKKVISELNKTESIINRNEEDGLYNPDLIQKAEELEAQRNDLEMMVSMIED